MKGQAVMFSAAKDEWATPQALFDAMASEFAIGLDVAATRDNCKAPLGRYLGPDHRLESYRDALAVDWWAASRAHLGGTVLWCNPPYSKCRDFIGKAAAEAKRGCTVVCLVYARTDTRWFHEHVYDATTNSYRPGVEVRFIKGRLKFGGAKAGAPAPSMLVIFRPVP